MKPISAITVLFTVFTPVLWAEAKPAPAMVDAATDEQLALQYQSASQNDPTRKLAPTKGPDPTVVNPVKDLISDSDVICFNGIATLVPKRAVLQIPKNVADRLKYKAGSKLMGWADFFSLNRGWITTVEVSRVQAEGNSPIGEDTQKQMSKSTNLIVATYEGGPISVLPAKVPVDKAPVDKAPIDKAQVDKTSKISKS